MLELLNNYNNPHYAENKALSRLAEMMAKQNKSLEKIIQMQQDDRQHLERRSRILSLQRQSDRIRESQGN